jgi:hypothetical protein
MNWNKRAALKEHERQVGARRWTLRNALVVGQLAVSIALLSAGLLFLRNLLHATSFNAGFGTAHTVVATLGTLPNSYTPERFAALVETGLERLRAIPGVEAAWPAFAVPLNPFLAFSKARGASARVGRRPISV